jgi:signal transduction histidine kinase
MSEANARSGGFLGTGVHRYTSADMVAATEVTRAEDPRWRWMFPVTRMTRDFVTAQFPVLQLSYVVAVALIYFSAEIDGKVGQWLINLWLIESAASFIVRWLMCAHVARVSPVEVAKKPALRLLPLFATALAALHWTWTATIFIGTTLDMTTVVVLLSFVMLSVAIIGIAPASPAICVVYLVPLWSVTTYMLLRTEWVSAGTFMVLLAALAAVLWSAFYIVVSGVRRYLVRGDEVDLLVAELRDRNAEVERLRTTAAHNLETRSAFFASASHDFRQRVHAMKLLAQAGLADAPQSERSPLARLSTVVEDLETYMTDVLEFARLESATLHPERSIVRLQQVFQRIEVQFEDIALAKRVELRVRATQVRLRSDGAMLMRILENLVSNAIKFTRARVLLAARGHRGEVRIEVRDLGTGIPLDCVDKVFDAFYQGQVTQEDAREGVGLGLAIVKRLADALGYRIEVTSSPGRGTLMRLVIPAQDVV